MTVTRHEVLTVTSSNNARSIRDALDEIPSDAELQDVEIDREWDHPSPVLTFTFRREVTND